MIWDDGPHGPRADDLVRRFVYVAVIVLAVVVAVLTARAGCPLGGTVIDRGSAAYYAPSYDNGGWERIIGRHIAWGQVDPSVAYSDAGYYCVRPGVALGTVLTLTNAASGAAVQCTVADSVAAGDQPYWWRHFVIEVSYRAWEALGLAQGNDVVVSA